MSKYKCKRYSTVKKKYKGGFGGTGGFGNVAGALGGVSKYANAATAGLSMYSQAFGDERAGKLAQISNNISGIASTGQDSFAKKQASIDENTVVPNEGMKAMKEETQDAVNANKNDVEFDPNTGLQKKSTFKNPLEMDTSPTTIIAKYGMRYTKGKGSPNKKYPGGVNYKPNKQQNVGVKVEKPEVEQKEEELSLEERKRRLTSEYLQKESDENVRKALAKSLPKRKAELKAEGLKLRNKLNEIMDGMEGWVPMK